MTCSKCKCEVKQGKKFCGNCGTPVQPEVRRCNSCNTQLEDGENFCSECGAKYTENTIPESVKPTNTVTTKPVFETGSLVSSESRSVLRLKKGISEEEKEAIKKLKKSPKFFLYDKEKSVIYLKPDDSHLEAYTSNNLQTPFARYTLSEAINKLWNKYYCNEMFYFYNNQDAFFAWNSYIFISVYEGQIRWTAADHRDAWHLPNEKADCVINYPGVPELEFLSNGNIKSKSFYDNVECVAKQGVLVPIQ